MPDWEPKWDAKAKRWTVDFSVETKRFRKRLGVRDRGFKDLARAEAKAVYKTAWENHLNPVKAKSMPFYQAAGGYVQSGGEARFLPPLIRYFGEDTCIDDIGEPEIVAASVEIYPGRQPDTHRRQVRVPINAVIRWARGERRRPSTDTKRTRWLTPEEFEPMLKASPEIVAKIAFLVGSGARPGEMMAVEVKDWNPITRQCWISAEEGGAGKTPLAARFVRLPPRSAELIGELPEVGRMFLTPKGKPYKLRKNGGGQIATAFAKARDLAGLDRDVTPYTLRHTWATWYYSQTRDFGGLLDLGGWAKADMANRYRKIAPDDLGDRLLEFGWDFRRDGDRGGIPRIREAKGI